MSCGRETMTKAEAVQRVLQIARQEIGYREKSSGSGLDDKTANAGGANYTKYARDLDAIPHFYNGPKNGYAWCDVFYDWLLVQAFGAPLAKRMLCQPDDSAGAGCSFSALYYRQAGRFYDNDPQPGDQIFFTFAVGEVSHTGIVESVSGGTVTTIEGNTSDSVARRSYQIGSGSIYGYGRPKWELAADVSETDTGSGEDPAPSPAPEPEPVGGPPYQLTLRQLKNGDVGVPVERIQTLLIARGYYCGGRMFLGREQPDGEFGPATEIAVRDLQVAAGIEADGIVGAKTMRIMLTK